MNAVAATFFDGRTSRARPVRLSLDHGALAIEAGDWRRSALLSSVRVSARVAGIHRTLLLADGGQLQVSDNDAVDAWFPRPRGAALVDRLERHPVAVAAALLISVLGIAGLFLWGIPYAANKVAAYLPASVTRAMGEQTAGLLERFGFDDSNLPQRRRDALQERFKNYVADLPDPAHYRLRFMHAPMANAFALPGGLIVVTDEMVRTIGASAAESGGDAGDGARAQEAAADGNDAASAADDGESAAGSAGTDDHGDDAAVPEGVDDSADDPERFKDADERFLAVVAHEIGHEENRHVLRSVLQSSGVILVGAYFTGDVSSASALVVSVPTFLLDSHYSRDFEAEADRYAFASLAAHGISPQRFAEVMSMLMRAEPAFRHEESGYLSTHPPTAERIRAAREAAANARGGS